MRAIFGCASIGGLYRPVTEEQAHDTLQAAWDLGFRDFDTAPHYGVGQSEELLGSFLRGKPREEYTVSTKVGRLLYEDPAAEDGTDGFFGVPRRSRRRDYSRDGVLRSLEASLERLGLDRVDTLFVHDPDVHLAEAVGSAAPALTDLRDQGVIGSYGVGTNASDVAETFVRETSADRIMVAGRYSLLDRRAEHSLLPLCAERGVRVLVAGVLNSGLLADPRPGAPFDYAPAPDHIIDMAQRMERACARHGVTLRAAALQFPTRHPAVEAVAIGTGRAASVRDTHHQLRTPVPEALWDELDTLLPDQNHLHRGET